MNVSCSHCSATFRVDPQKIPAGGVNARCSVCGGVFFVAGPEAPEAPPERSPATEPRAPEPAPAASPPTSPSAPGLFGGADPQSKARRLARALVSDIAVYHPERRDRGLQSNTLRQEFREEIGKSWEEYVDQVGEEIARSTPYFRDALNEILARGQRVF